MLLHNSLASSPLRAWPLNVRRSRRNFRRFQSHVKSASLFAAKHGLIFRETWPPSGILQAYLRLPRPRAVGGCVAVHPRRPAVLLWLALGERARPGRRHGPESRRPLDHPALPLAPRPPPSPRAAEVRAPVRRGLARRGDRDRGQVAGPPLDTSQAIV